MNNGKKDYNSSLMVVGWGIVIICGCVFSFGLGRGIAHLEEIDYEQYITEMIACSVPLCCVVMVLFFAALEERMGQKETLRIIAAHQKAWNRRLDLFDDNLS